MDTTLVTCEHSKTTFFCELCKVKLCVDCIEDHTSSNLNHKLIRWDKIEVSESDKILTEIHQHFTQHFPQQKVILEFLMKSKIEEAEKMKKDHGFYDFVAALQKFSQEYSQFTKFLMQFPISNEEIKQLTESTENHPRSQNRVGDVITTQLVSILKPPTILPKPEYALESINPPMDKNENKRKRDPKNEGKQKVAKIQHTTLEILKKLLEFVPFDFFKEVTQNTQQRSYDSYIYNPKEYNESELEYFYEQIEKKSIIFTFNQIKSDPENKYTGPENPKFASKGEFLKVFPQPEIEVIFEYYNLKQIEDYLYRLNSSSLLKIQNDIFKTRNISYKDKTTMIKKILSLKRKK